MIRVCVRQLVGVFMNIFNHSHSLCVVPSCFKSSVIVPVPKKCKVTCLNYCCPLLYSLCTHDCVPTQKFSLVIKFADNTMVIGLITNSDEMAYRAEIRALAQWIQENNLSLNIDKNKELIVDYRKKDGLHDSISISGTTVEMVTSHKSLGVYITNDIIRNGPIRCMVKKAQQHSFHLRKFKKFGIGPMILQAFYQDTTESVLTW